MATWAELQARARSDFDLDDEADHRFAVTIAHHPAGRLREQRVIVRHFTAWGREMVEIRSAFGERGDYAAEELLIDNLMLPLGAIASHGQFLVVVYKAVLGDLSVDAVVFLITRVGQLADALEERRGIDRY